MSARGRSRSSCGSAPAPVLGRALQDRLAAAHGHDAVGAHALQHDHATGTDGDVVKGGVQAADVVQEAPTRAAQRLERGRGPVLGTRLGVAAPAPAEGRPAAAAEHHPGAGAPAGDDAGQPGDLVAVEDEHEEADREHAERDGQLGQHRGGAGARSVVSVQIGWLIVHSHPPA